MISVATSPLKKKTVRVNFTCPVIGKHEEFPSFPLFIACLNPKPWKNLQLFGCREKNPLGFFAIFADRQKFAMGPRQNALAAVLLFVALSQQGCEDYYRCLADFWQVFNHVNYWFTIHLVLYRLRCSPHLR